VKLSSVIILRICPSDIPCLILACDIEEHFVHNYWKDGLFLSNALTNSFIIPSLMCKGGSRIFHGQQDLRSRHFWILVAIAPFRANVQYPNVCPWPCYPTRLGNREILCSLFVVPAAIFKSRHILNFRRAVLIAYLEGVCYECTRQTSTTI
jgi:hypothetical protein